MQVILSELLRRFTFALPSNVDIHIAVAVTVIPVPTGLQDPSLPLLVRRIE
jgi:alkylphenol/PAH-inducible cytochrome P450 monooxygenase